MRGFWLLVHVLGFTLWLGGGIATMVAGISAKSFAPTERLRSYKLIGAIQRLLVGPGAIAVVLSGIVLSMPYMRSGDMPGWLNLMMGAGVLGALAAVGISVLPQIHQPSIVVAGLVELAALLVELPQASIGRRQRQGFVVRTLQAGRRDRALVDGERRVALARLVVGACESEQPTRRAGGLLVPGAVLLDRVPGTAFRERDRGGRAVTERLAPAKRLGDRYVVLREQLPPAVGPPRLRVQPRQPEIRPIRNGDRG